VTRASRRFPVEIKRRHPELLCADFAGAGSVYRHAYEDVREQRLWSALQKHMAPLLAVVEQELRDLGELP